MLTRSQSSFAGDPVSKKSTTGLVAEIGNHTGNFGSTLQSPTALSVGEAEFYAVVKGGQVGLSLRSVYQDLGIPMKVEIQSDSSTANSWTHRLGQAVLLDTRSSPRRRSQYQEGAYSEELRRCWNEYCNIASLQDWYSTDPGSHTPLQDEGLQTQNQKHRNRQLSTLIVNIKTGCVT